MPGYTTEIGPKGKAIARATLRVPGDWDTLTDTQKAAWNAATSAIDRLLDMYLPAQGDE